MKTSFVQAAMRNHFPTNEFALMFEVGNATGGQVRRWADAVTMNLWPSRGLTITGYEIKVSRSDWLSEMRNPAKAEAVAQYCDFWTLVTPANIVQDHEIPLTWGHLIVNDRGAIISKKRPEKLDNTKALDRSFLAAMLRRASSADDAVIADIVNTKLAKERADMQAKIDKEVERRTERGETARKKIAELAQHGLDITYGYPTIDEIVKHYKLGKKLADTAGTVKHNRLKESLSEVVSLMDGLQSEMAELADIKE